MNTETPNRFDFIRGDRTGLDLPTHEEALRQAGPDFLTSAFRAFGSLGQDNAVTRIVGLSHCPGGSTGSKLFATVEYARPDPALHTGLFVKFSRDFTDARRDGRGRWEMQPEVPFQAMSRLPGFPIEVPVAYFADYHDESGTGIVITEAVPYGDGRIEAHRLKTMDHKTLDDPVAYYRAQVTALARLAGAHKSGRLAPDIEAQFPFDPVAGSADPIRYSDEELAGELQHCIDFARRAPQLLPAEVRSDAFLAKMEADTWTIRRHEAEIQRYLTGNPDFHALCHWNAHIDNCYFWRDEAGAIHCGLIDWGRVGQITLGSALWGGLSAAHHSVWDEHIDELLALFAAEYHAAGGPRITPEELEFHLTLHMAAMGVARVLAFPEEIVFRLPECLSAEGPFDPMFEGVEPARNCLHVYTVFLKFWLRQDFGAHVERLLARAPA